MSEQTPKPVTLTIDGKEVTVPAGTTIWEAAREAGLAVPTLCHDPALKPVGVCRMCVVDGGERVLAAACVRPCQPGMTVTTATEEILRHRKTLTALLLSEYPDQSARQETTGDDALLALAETEGLDSHKNLPYPDGGDGSRGRDDSSPVIRVDHQACILCDRCIRACGDLQIHRVISRTGKGITARIAFDLDQPMGNSTCVACGECAAYCPTGALTDRSVAGLKIQLP